MKNSYLVLSIALAILLFGAVTVFWPGVESSEVLVGSEAVVYRDQSCGCCEVHERYLENLGVEVETEIISPQAMQAVKAQYGIPLEISSCHTTVIDGYVVEGHMPQAAIERLLSEQPEIEGIALPGMPSGSPGMPGPKREPFVIHSLLGGGASEIFMEL